MKKFSAPVTLRGVLSGKGLAKDRVKRRWETAGAMRKKPAAHPAFFKSRAGNFLRILFG